MQPSLSELEERVAKRNLDQSFLAFQISPENLATWYKIYQPVTDEELKKYAIKLKSVEIEDK